MLIGWSWNRDICDWWRSVSGYARVSRLPSPNMAAQWPEVERAEREKRRELVLQGVDERLRHSDGRLPPDLFSLSLLNYLQVSGCAELRELPADIGRLVHLQSLVLCQNKLRSLPGELAELRSLKVLDVSGNELEELPPELCNLPELCSLNVSCNRLSHLPPGLHRATRLASINLSRNDIATFPPGLLSAQLSLLAAITASDNRINELPGDIALLPALKVPTNGRPMAVRRQARPPYIYASTCERAQTQII